MECAVSGGSKIKTLKTSIIQQTFRLKLPLGAERGMRPAPGTPWAPVTCLIDCREMDRSTFLRQEPVTQSGPFLSAVAILPTVDTLRNRSPQISFAPCGIGAMRIMRLLQFIGPAAFP